MAASVSSVRPSIASLQTEVLDHSTALLIDDMAKERMQSYTMRNGEELMSS